MTPAAPMGVTRYRVKLAECGLSFLGAFCVLLDEVLFKYTSYSTLYSQSHQLVSYVTSVLHENHTQRLSIFWHRFDFDGILRVLGSFLYAICCFGALIRVQKTESMSDRLQRFVVIFHRHLHHIFLEVYGQCLHVGVFHFPTACGAPIGQRSFSFADVPLKFDELTRDLCPTYGQFHHMIIFCHRSAVLQHFPHFHRSVPTKAFRTGACL